ncbi:MAG: hypothetical protein ACOC7S_00850 [Planctomycetota bacterium]
MAQRAQIEFPFPLKGIDRHWAYRRQPGLTTPDCLNVRAYGTIEGRARGGQRPGLRARYWLPASAPIRLLAPLTVTQTADSYTGTDEDTFDEDEWDSDWGAAAWSEATMRRQWGLVRPAHAKRRTAVIRNGLELSATHQYTIQLDTVKPTHCDNQRIKIFAQLDDVNPDIDTEGLDFSLHLDGWTYGGSLTKMVAGEEDAVHDYATGTWEPADFPRTYKVSIDGSDILVTWGNIVLLDATVSPLAGLTVGFGTSPRQHHGVYMDNWLVTGTRVSGDPMPRQSKLCAVCDGSFYQEERAGELEEVEDPAASFSTERTLMAAQTRQRLFIADFGPDRAHGGDGVIGGDSHDELTAASIDDWTDLGIDTATDLVLLYNAEDDGPREDTYEIVSVASDTLTLAGTADENGSCSYRIMRGPKHYKYGEGLSLWRADPGKGTLPLGAQVLCVYRGRVVLARNEQDPHNWWMSRIADPFDWQYGETDQGSAVAGDASDAGEVGDMVTALIPYSDDFLIFGCVGSLWVLRGDPMAGGVLDAVNYTVGVLDRFAWCHGAGGEVYFLSQDGLYRMAATGQSLENISAKRVPEDLSGINTDVYETSMCWDAQGQGVHIFITPRAASKDPYHWFYDVRTGGFFRDKHVAAHGPTYTLNYEADASAYRGLLLGGNDGVLRSFDEASPTDDGETIESYVFCAPQRMAGDLREGVLTQISATLAEQSDPVDYQLHVGDSHQEAYNASPRAVGTWTCGGRSRPTHCRVRGGSIVLRLANDRRAEEWALEQITGLRKAVGRQR